MRWRLCTADAAHDLADGSPLGQWLLHKAAEGTRSLEVAGFLVYEILERAELVAHRTPSSAAANCLATLNREAHDWPTRNPVYPTCRAFVAGWRDKGSKTAFIARFAAWLARVICSANVRMPFAHAVCVTRRFCWRSLLGTLRPTRRDLDVFRRRTGVIVEGAAASGRIHGRTRRRRELKGWPGQHDGELVLAWLEASKFISDQKRTQDAAKAFAALFARGKETTAEEMMTDLEKVSMTVLRQARVRADACAMLLWRNFFRQISDIFTSANIHLYCDGSPQWRGRELYASSIDIIIDDVISRTALPILYLDRGEQDRYAKTIALMWQLALVCGIELLPLYLTRVRSILTDAGVERFIPTMPDTMLEDFYWYFGLPVPETAPQVCDVGALRLQTEALCFKRMSYTKL